MDPMGSGHAGAIARLKEYLVTEADNKRGMEIAKDTFQGMNARKGIPQQQNYYDCGIFLCGYLHNFMQNPVEFGRKLLMQDFDETADWPEMQPDKMRADMRILLQGIGKEQQEARAARKKEKTAEKKKKLALTAKSGVVDLSSPVKPQEVTTKIAEEKREKTASPAASSPPTVPARPDVKLDVADADNEDIKVPSQRQEEVLLRQGAASIKQEAQSQEEAPKDHISDSDSDVKPVAGGVKPDFEIFEDPGNKSEAESKGFPPFETIA
jgi:hypothetical protein